MLPLPLSWFELSAVTIFTIEYVFRVWSCVEDPRYSHFILITIEFSKFNCYALVQIFEVLLPNINTLGYSGIGLFALPTGILGAGFVEEIRKTKDTSINICPHCGKDIDSEKTKDSNGNKQGRCLL